jgi:tyrosine-protein kinase
MRLEDFLHLVRQRRLGLLVILVTTLICVAAWTESREREYTSAASGIVTTTDSKSIAESYSGSILAQSMAKSYLMLFTSRTVAQQVIEELGLDMTPESLMSRLTAMLPTGTVTIRVEATAASPQLARDIANSVVAAAAQQIREFQGRAAGSGGIKVVPVEPAGLPNSPSFPVRTTTYGAGLLAGLVLALSWALLRQRTDTKLRSLADIEGVSGNAALGVVPASKPLSEEHRALSGGRGSRLAAEAFRQMRTNLRFVAVDRPPRAIVVTSSVAGEGKSTVAANLARVIARGGDPVVLIDADLRRPSLQTVFDLDEAIGLTQVLAGSISLVDVLQDGDEDNLRLIAAGRLPHNPSELLGSQRMRALVAELAQANYVIIDSPPLLPVTDAALLAASADGALLVCRTGRIRRAHLVQSLRNLHAVDALLLGVVVNGVNTGRRAARDGYGYYAGASSEDEYSTATRRHRSST